MNNFEECNDNKFPTELNFTEHWSDLILQEELNRGAILRGQKIKKNMYHDFHDIKNEVCNGPSTSKTNQFYEIHGKQTCCKFKTKKWNTKTCPLRIAEIAVPSKRKCIDTWRTKSNVIPNIMVERLKQRVMDERPIVEINDAINCFKRTKIKHRRRRFITTPRSTYESVRMKKIKILCAIFGFKIIHKLQKPMNISLTSSLDRINNIVSEEIITLLKYKNQKSRNVKGKDILDEVSRQITFWIVNILDETDYKLLEENLQELEEREGPALDFIDDLIDRVLSICAPSRHEIYEKLPEQNLPESLMSPIDSDDEIIVEVLQSNVTQLINGICLDLLKDAEEQIEQNYDNSLLYEHVSKIRKGVLNDPSIISNSSENISEYLRQELEATIKEIPGKLIVDEIRRQDEQDGDLLIEHYGGKRESETVPKFYSKELNDYIEDFPDLLAKEKKSEPDLDLSYEQSNKLNYNYNTDSKANPLDIFVSTTEVNDAFGEKIDNILEKEDTLLKEFEIDKNKSQLDKAENKGSQGGIEIEHKIDNAIKILDKESFTKNNETRGADNNFQFMDAESKDLYLLHRSSDTAQIIENVLNKILDLVAKEFKYDDEDIVEDINKKVKFSAIDMGNLIKTELPESQSHELLLQKSSSDYLKLQTVFAPPNEHLLSNADESWPQDMPLPTLKVTESVNKSVTSLGNILEAKENEISYGSSNVSIRSSGVLLDLKLGLVSADKKINDKTLPPFQNEKDTIKEKNIKDKIKQPKPKEIERKRQVNNKKTKNSNIKHEENPRGLKNNIKPAANKNVHNKPVSPKFDNSINIKKSEDLPRKHNMRLQVKNKIQYEKKLKPKVVQKEKGKIKPKEKIIGKRRTTPKRQFKKAIEVLPKTIHEVSIEAKGDNHKEEQNYKACLREKLFSVDDKTKRTEMRKIDDYKIQKWCKGLENVIENLEIWNAWMNSTCKCVTFLKHKEKIKSSRTEEKCRRKWKMLHRNIQKDRILWEDIKKRNEDGLKSFQKIYGDIKTGETKFQICDCSNL